MKPWFRRFKRAIELHFTGSTVHTSRADACADSALIAFSSSPFLLAHPFDPLYNVSNHPHPNEPQLFHPL